MLFYGQIFDLWVKYLYTILEWITKKILSYIDEWLLRKKKEKEKGLSRSEYL